MDLVGSIIVWVIGLPLALIIGCFMGVAAYLLHCTFTGDQNARHRILAGSAAAALASFLGVVLALGTKWWLLVAVFLLPLTFGNIMGVHAAHG